MSSFDLQVNGYGGIDFNQDNLTAEDLQRSLQRLEADGVTGILATIITEEIGKMEGRIRRLAELRESTPLAKRMIAGIHIEGPFISPKEGYRGAHPPDAIRPAEVDLMKRLLDAGSGLVRLVTLAPEQDPSAHVTRFLATQKVTISAGHTEASMDQLKMSLDAGLEMFTHLGNGCPGLLPRHDNIIQRALFLRDQLWICLIGDGVHIPFPTLRNMLDLIGNDGKVIFTTDCISAAGLGPGRYQLARWDLVIGEDLAARSPDGSHLVGSAVSMPRVIDNLQNKVGLSLETIQKMIDVNPRKALKLK
ncbi:MAG: N-acetylglucosamine-6-phosphate deacetylase [Verrucomicrobiota bacterium]